MYHMGMTLNTHSTCHRPPWDKGQRKPFLRSSSYRALKGILPVFWGCSVSYPRLQRLASSLGGRMGEPNSQPRVLQSDTQLTYVAMQPARYHELLLLL